MQEHRCRRESSAEPERLLDLARTTLAAAGFRVGPAAGGELVAEGLPPMSTKRNPLTLATRIRVRAAAGGLELEAELGGVRRLRAFVLVFPLGLGLLISASFALAARFGGMPPGAWWIPLVAASPWLVLAPLMAAWIRRRAIAAVERLADSLASA